jgi:hypothetical protein
LYDGSVPQPIDPEVYNGAYTIRVEDLDGNWSEVTDELDVNPIIPPVETTFQPSFSTQETLVAYFDDVYVNGALWDDFESDVDPGKWIFLPDGVTRDGGELRFERIYATPKEPLFCHMNNEPTPFYEVKATVRPNSIHGEKSMAGITANFWKDALGDVTCILAIQEDGAICAVLRDYLVDGHLVHERLVPSTLLTVHVTQDQSYQLSMQWNGTQVMFKVYDVGNSQEYTHTYAPPGEIEPANDPKVRIGLMRPFYLDTTTPDLSWDPVDGAAFYRVRFYHSGAYVTHSFFRDYTSQPSYTMPPGVLKPYGLYYYRIEAYREHQGMDVDNASRSEPTLQMVVAGPEEAQSPFISLADNGVQTWSNDAFGGLTFTNFHIEVHDAQGVPGTIQSVRVRLPDGTTETSLYLGYNDTPTCGIYRGQYFGSIQSGDYTFTVVDNDGNTYSTTETLTVDPLSPPVAGSFFPADNSLINGTEVTIDWDDVAGASLYQVLIYNKYLWQIYDFQTADSECTIPPGLLAENSLYRYQILARREYLENNSDNVSIAPFSYFFGTSFLTTPLPGDNEPSIDVRAFGAAVLTVPNPDTGVPTYTLELWANITDADGVPENIKKVEVTLPGNGETRLLTYLNAVPFGSNYYHIEYITDPASIPEGLYTFKVVDFEDNEATVTDTLSNPVANILPWATNLSPADDEWLVDTTPVISWDAVPGATYYKLRIMNSFGTSNIYFSGPITATQFRVPSGILGPYTTYSYRVYAVRDAIDDQADFYSSTSAWNTTGIHFTTGEGPTDEFQAGVANFGRTDCTSACFGNSDGDNDVDGADLANYIAEMNN